VSDRRIEPEDLGALEGLPTDDPLLRQLESQPRARAQYRAYRDFVAPGDVPEGARVHEAEARLAEVLERELGTPIGRTPEAVPGARSAAPARSQGGGGFLSLLFGPRMRPAFALAVMLVVAGGVWIYTATRQPGEPILRGGTRAGPLGGPVGGVATGRLADGTVRLTWTPSAGAESYAVVFLSPELAEIARVRGITETHLDLRPGALPAGLMSRSQVLWRVVAMRGPDELTRSSTLTVTLP
jgi:hypothetical protein